VTEVGNGDRSCASSFMKKAVKNSPVAAPLSPAAEGE
jgi:hypothetical protein